MFCLKKRTRAHVLAAAQKALCREQSAQSTRERAGRAGEGEDAARRDGTQRPQQRRGISSSWWHWEVGLHPTLHVGGRDAGGYLL